MKKILFLFPLLCATMVFAQQQAFVQFKTQELYEEIDRNKPENIDGFTALTIFGDDLDNTVWASPEKNCVTLAQQNIQLYKGNGALHVKWDKITGGCTWIGIGFGWNNWQPKDMSGLSDDTAIQLQVRSVSGTFSNLPVAFALEDYTGTQAFCGFNKTMVTSDFNDTEWRTVTIPLRKFPFLEKDFDDSKVKQFIIQLEADGDIYLDNICLVKLEKS